MKTIEDKTLAVLLCIAFTLITGGCRSIEGQLNSASYGTPKPGSTFIIEGSGSLTLTERHIQDLIKKELFNLGFKEAIASTTADFAVIYSYSIGAGKTVVSSSPDFVWGGQQISSSTSYPRYFQISIADIPASHNQNKPVFIWQAEIYSSGTSQNISWFADQFVPELFKRYGKTINNENVLKFVNAP
ncbi:MAG: hypothetical protein ABSG22_11305 [Sedimentisphaerales bacterium]